MNNSPIRLKDQIHVYDTTYQMISKMAHGGMGEIYLVKDVATGQLFALKRYFSHAFECQEDCEKFWHREQEIMHIQSRSPVRAIKLIDAFTKSSEAGETEYYLLMEYVQGITLEEWIKQHPSIPDQEHIDQRLSQIIIPLCRHLEYVHSQGIIHRDITPRNIMLINEDNALIPILIDWGTAKQQTVSHISRPISTTAATKITSIGNPPEVLAGLEPVIASDVYMMGYILNYLLTAGQTPHPIREQEYVLDPSKFNPNVWLSLSKLVREMTCFNSAERIQPFSKIIDQLQQELAEKKLRLLHAQQEQERLAWDKQVEERLAHERQEQEQLDREKQKEERLAHEWQEQKRLAQEKQEEERLIRVQEERYRLIRKKQEEERLIQVQQEQERLAQKNMRLFKILQIYEKEVKENPNNDEIWIKWGNELEKIGEYSDACEKYAKAAEINPRNDLTWEYWGNALDKLEKYREACNKYAKAVEINSLNGFHNTLHIGALINLREYNEAVNECAKAVQKDPNNANLWTDWGRALNNLGKFQEASEKCARAVEINPQQETAWINWWYALQKLGKSTEAIEKFACAAEVNPWQDFNITIPSRLGLKLEKKFARTVESDPQNDLAWARWGWILSKLRKYIKAAEKYAHVVVIKPQNDIVWTHWGRTLFELQKFTKAADKFAQAVQINPQNTDAWEYWGYTLDLCGRIYLSESDQILYEEAQSKYKQTRYRKET